MYIYIYILCQKYLTTFHCITVFRSIPLYSHFAGWTTHFQPVSNIYDVSKANETLHLQWKHYAQQGKTSFEGEKNLPSTKQAKWIKMDGIFMVYTCSHHQNSNENRCLWMTMDDYGWWVVYGWLWMLMDAYGGSLFYYHCTTGYPHGDAMRMPWMLRPPLRRRSQGWLPPSGRSTSAAVGLTTRRNNY